jgi:hypothetical protein
MIRLKPWFKSIKKQKNILVCQKFLNPIVNETFLIFNCEVSGSANNGRIITAISHFTT